MLGSISIDPALDALRFGPASATPPVGSTDRKEVREAAEAFEAMFLSQLLEEMFAEVDTDGLFGTGASGSIYRSMLIDEYGKAMSRRGGIGIADAVERELIKLQEAQ
jgi:Rod binding domain-containing protein